MTNVEFIASMREILSDHDPDGWPAVQTHEVSRLLSIIDNLVPVMDRLEERLAAGCHIRQQDDGQGPLWHLWSKSGDSVVSGKTIREMLTNLIFHEDT